MARRSKKIGSGEVTPRRDLSVFFKSVTAMKNDKEGQRGIVLGSGPSMKDFDHRQLDDPELVTVAINEEGHRNLDRFVPDYWIFSDLSFLDRIVKNKYKPNSKTQIVMHDECEKWISERNLVLPKTDSVPAIFKGSKRLRKTRPSEFPMNKTTATAAISLLLLLGVRDMWLGGVDLCYREDDSYYLDNDPQRRPIVPTERNSMKMGGDIRCTQRNIEMIADLTALKEDLEDHKFEASVFQGCLYSPMSCFGKSSFKRWFNG